MSNGTTESLLGIIPVAIAGGMIIKFTDWAMQQQPKAKKGFPKRGKAKRKPKELYFGDFRNLGYD